MQTQGKYIVIEGNDGTGKSTQVDILAEKLEKAGKKVHKIHEPGGSAVSDEIRKIIKNGKLPRKPLTNLLLFTASRYEIWQEVEEKLQAGYYVLASRNWFSTLTYQGYGEGLDIKQIKKITTDFLPAKYIKPDFCVILTIGEIDRVKRLKLRDENSAKDTFESKDISFQSRVNYGYDKISEELQVSKISTDKSPEKVGDEIWQKLNS